MFVGVGVGAYAAGIFHLMTHAFFKGLLFLGAGSVMHAMSGELDMRKMGGLWKKTPVTWFTCLLACLAIAGFPGFSGFFSKDEILWQAFSNGHPVLWLMGLAGAALTAFYMFRLIFLTFFGPDRMDEEAKRHLHESPRVMTAPLQVLAVLAAVGGYVGLPRVLGGGAWFGRFLAPSVGEHEAGIAGGTELLLMALSAAIGIGGILAAHAVYVRKEGRPAARFVERFPAVYRLVSHLYYVDDVYNKVLVRGVMRLGSILGWIDEHVVDGLVNGAAALVRAISRLAIGFDGEVIDGAVNGIGSLSRLIATGLRGLQTGFVYNYALAIVLGLVIIIALVVTIL